MNVVIVGGGNIGTAMCAEFANHGHCVSLLTSKPDCFSNVLSVQDDDLRQTFSGTLHKISNQPQELLPDAELIIVTLPAFLMPHFAEESLPFVKPGTILVAMPGYGGVEFIFRNHVKKGAFLVGFQRVPAVYRLIEYGKISRLSGRRSTLCYASVPAVLPQSVHTALESVFSMPCQKLPNFLSVTLTPSNPILHTSRLYGLFSTTAPDAQLESNPFFYSDWDDFSSEILIQNDAELQLLLKKFPELDLSDVRSLKVHYESPDIPSMTAKLRSIQSLSGIYSPMVSANGKYTIDWSSRYFLADFPFGLAIIKGIAVLADMDTPNIDRVLSWYAKQMHLEYYAEDGSFTGKDLIRTGIPQNYNILSRDELIQLYL